MAPRFVHWGVWMEKVGKESRQMQVSPETFSWKGHSTALGFF